MRAAIYARVSDVEQVRGYSIDEQLRAMRAYCAAQGWQIVAEFVEPGSSARRGMRSVFEEVLSSGQAGDFDVLVTHKLDRFFRNLKEMLVTIEDKFNAWGVTYVSVVEAIDYSTPHGKLLLNQLGSVAQYFSDNLATEVRKGKRGRAKSGLSNASWVPFGYRRAETDQAFVIEPDEARTLIRIFELYASGAYSLTHITAMLNREGIPAAEWSKRGRWTSWAIGRILRNPFYMGLTVHTNSSTGEQALYPGQHEALVSRELWEKAQEVRQQRARKQARHAKHHYLLQSIVFCSHCGGLLHCEIANPPHSYYRDVSDRRGIDCAVSGQRVRLEVIDLQVEELIRRLRLPDDWKTRIVELANHHQEQDDTERKRKALEARLERLKFLYLDGDLDEAEYRRRRGDLQAELRAIRPPTGPTIIQAGEYLDTLGALWDKATVEQKHTLLQGMVRKVRVDLQYNRVTCIEPHAEFVALFRQIEGLVEKDENCFWWEDEEGIAAG